MAKIVNGGIPLTPKQFILQWTHIPHKFEVGLWGFEATMAREAVAIFKRSFDLRRLNSDGAPSWPERKKHYPHPILNETGTLKNSIRSRRLEQGVLEAKTTRGVQIYTDPARFGTAKRHKGFCYAAVHNAPDGKYTYGKSGAPSVQRQFIGHSTEIDDKIRECSMKLISILP